MTAATISDRLASAGVALPEAAAPAANYVPFVLFGNSLQTSGQLPIDGGKLAFTGKLGGEVSLEDGQKAARFCAINILAQANAALGGDLGRIRRLLKITVFVASEPGFTDQHKVANGASDFLVDILGDAGRHARSAVGVPCLPLGAAVEIEALFEIA
jgi:enamine deaminase RidA (YjgF/YER057c/UK114 family)